MSALSLSALSRRTFLLTASTLLAAQAPPPPPTIRLPPEPAAPAPAAAPPAPVATMTGNTLSYRGFTVDMSLAASRPDRAAIEASLKKQLDITADCGAKPEIMAFFRSQGIKLKTGGNDGGGRFSSAGIEIQAAVQPPEKPIVLHELIHALHARYLPNANRNADVLRFYHNALSGQLYPRSEYVLRNVNEFFAVTASLYLWGYVARAPNDRATLRAKQPYYYAWLGELFGVKK
jgi:hypothetical protein